MTEVKTFRMTGEVKKPRTTIPFALELRATKRQDAIERVYAEMGSRHKARRLEIKLEKIEELKTSETETKESGK
ncbi:MAG TPA: 50S ribosomal protein L18Ae [Candidatus Acidoferrum sp.]|nr:50S ribosomal protein L18Ae [Candidatus Acidoferrum sp.]